MKMFQALKKGVTGTPKVLPYPTDLSQHITDQNKDWYKSLYQYSETHKKLIEEKKSFKGIEDTTTDRLVFDIDSADLIEAQKQTGLLIHRLIDDGIDLNSIQAFFTGKKGFSLEVEINERLNPEQFKEIIKTLSQDFSCLDTKIVDPVRIIRVPNTKHQDSGLFKIPLDIDEIANLEIKRITDMATTPREWNFSYTRSNLPASYKVAAPKKERPKSTTNTVIDWVNKPKEWRNCKWSLLQGVFNSGERHQALTVIAATCRGLGFDRETAYYLCKSAIKKQAKLYKGDEFSTDEVWENILESIYSPSWKGGQYSCQNDIWLQEKCNALGDHKCSKDKNINPTIQIEEAYSLFKDYAENIDKLTIKTGIDPLDSNLRMTIGMLVGLVAPAGVGKTSISLQVLNTMSKNDELCVFFSFDMFHALVFQKLVQKHFQKDADTIFDDFSNNPEVCDEITKQLGQEYKNVEFCFDAGQTPDQMAQTIKSVEDKRAKKVRLIVVDYNELVLSDKSDPTAHSAYVIQKLREIANTHNCCVLILLQPNKMSGNPAEEINSYHAAKGSSAISQAVSIMLGINRPGYDPKCPETDKFITVNCLKNRMGKLFSVDLHWDGLTGTVRQLTDEEYVDLYELRKKKKEEAAHKDEWL
jgi:hypothetical protein